jgi:NAD+ synthase
MNCQIIKDVIINWLNNELIKSSQKGFVIGISGGIDSALVSTLCALTGKPTLLISLPIHQADDQLKRANEHINFLISNFKNVKSLEIDATKTFEEFKSSFSKEIQEDELTMANLRSRIRMCILYTNSGHYQYLVAGTGNKIEDFGIGFFTKYGDGAVDISPIGDLTKTQVRELSRYLNIDNEIVKAKPTDGLWKDNRGDEDQIGASYEELEWAMTMNELIKIKNNNFNFTDRQKEILDIYCERNSKNKHKMVPIPICKIPKTAF